MTNASESERRRSGVRKSHRDCEEENERERERESVKELARRGRETISERES